MDVDECQPRSPVAFVALLFVFSVPFFFLARTRLLPAGLPDFPAGALMALLPTSIGLALTARERGGRAARRLLASAVDVRTIRPLWYAPVLLLLPLTYLLAQKLSSALGPPLPPGVQLWQAPGMYLSMFVVLFLLAIGEEVGWMGYLARPLQARWGALGASLAIGVVWAAWHVPAYLVAGHTLHWVIWQCTFTVLLRVLIFWVSRNNAASLVAAEIVHAESNIGYRTFPDAGALYDPYATSLVLAGWLLLILLLWDGRTLDRLRLRRTAAA